MPTRKQQKSQSISRRIVSPLRGNANSLPPIVQAHIIVDIDQSKAKSLEECKLIHWPLCNRYPGRKLRDTHWDRAHKKYLGNATLWKNTVDHALNIIANYEKDQEQEQEQEQEKNEEEEEDQVHLFTELPSKTKPTKTPTRSKALGKILEESDDNSEEYIEEAPKPKAARKPTHQQTQRMSNSYQTRKHSQGTTENLSEATKQLANFLSEADADVDQNRPAAENVFLSGSYMVSRSDEIGNSTDHVCYAIIVVTASLEDDAKRVDAKAFCNNGTGNANVVRIEKPAYPSWMSGNKLKKVTSCVFGTGSSAAKAFRKSVIRGKGKENVTLVDVHFENPIHATVSKLGYIHLKMNKENSTKCTLCGFRELLELPNVAAFQVEEVVYHQTSEKTVGGFDGELSVSE